MSALTAFLAKFLGAYMIVMSAWLVLRKDVALELVERISQDAVGIAIIGMIRVAVGLAIAIAHDVWVGATAILVSLVGWLILMSGLLTLFMPAARAAALVGRMRYAENMPLFALINFALGVALLAGGFTG